MKSKGSEPTVKEDVILYTHRRLNFYELCIQPSTEFQFFVLENCKLRGKSRLIAVGLGIVLHTMELKH